MKSIQEFLLDIAKQDIKLWIEGDKLRCNAPQGVLTPEIHSQLTQRKVEIISFLQDYQQQVIPKVPRNNQYVPLSSAQERLWFLNQLEGKNTTYNMPCAIRITGNLNITTLEKAFSEIIRRHEILRTNFKFIDDKPVQIIRSEFTLEIPVIDLHKLSVLEREIQVSQLVKNAAETIFDLENSSLLQLTVLKLSPSEFVLLFTMHHIISDGWSIGILIEELSIIYQAFYLDKPSPLPELSIQYADFSVWQKQYLSEEKIGTQLNYWKQQLQGCSKLLELPTDRPRPAVQTFRGDTQIFDLDIQLKEKLVALSQESGTTLFMTLQAAFATLLYRYSGQSDILIGSPIANRDRSELEPLIGFFVNTVVFRNCLENNPSFTELLTQVREMMLKAYEHQDVPFEQVVEALHLERSLSYSPLFQVMFAMENTAMGELQLPDVTLTPFKQQNTTAKFDLTLSIDETSNGLTADWEYNTDLFDGETITRMADNFQNLLNAITENPQQKLDEIPFLTADEKYQLLVEWNDTQTEYPQDKCIHQLFEEQVEKTPNAVAIVFENQQLTYQELNNRANQLAHHLQTLGVKPEVLVGICLNRSLEMMVGLLAILKAGGAYVPLDPTYPSERLDYMLTDSQLPILLTQNQLLAKLPQHQAQTICLDQDWEKFADYPEDNPNSQVQPDNLAYIIYTSGSTGKPKGTMIIHSGMVNYLSWCTKAYNVAAGEGSTVNSSIGFDATITSLFSPLLIGRKVVLLPEENEIEELKQALCSGTKFSLVKITPAHLEMLSHLLANQEVNIQAQAFIIGGEALSEKVTNFWQKKAPLTKLINEYGPTETVVGCCIYEVKKQSFPGGNIPIGRPIANTELYILDSQLQPVPIGVVGELYIGGAGVARGYLNRPELTQERFIDNPFNHIIERLYITSQSVTSPSIRSPKLYKTGDLARYLPDSNIEYLGRIDHQVKIRGFRIELGEIEALIVKHPTVASATVIVREDETGNKNLVAYIVPEKSQTFQNKKLHQLLQEKLPHYMIPSAFVQLENLPLTPNGKVDRKALSAPEKSEIYISDDFLTPRNEVELQLTNIWEEILNVRPIGIQDNFFNLGGHSLLVVRLMAQIQQHFGINLPLATILQNPTIAQITNTLSQQTNSLSNSTLVAINKNGSQTPLFCVPGVGGNGLYFYKLADYLGSEQPFYTFQARGLDSKSIPHNQIEDMAADYIQAMQTVQPQGPYILGGYSFGSNIALEMTKQLQQQGHEVALLAVLDNFAPIEINKPKDFYLDAKIRLKHIIRVVERLSGQKLEVDYQTWEKLNFEEQLNYLREQFNDSTTEQIRGLIEVFDANVQAGMSYSFNPLSADIYSLKITLFQAKEDDTEDTFIPTDITWGWNKITSQAIEIYTVPGNHHTMLSEPHVQVLAEKLKACINQVQIVGVA
ncbi:amino acid adenylation domain-containing protein [Calothrix sp. UHCC 0171]|uniref:amino acid adenylation domain-containing protein n=1 Tax=Calothrix sp. UHCC 0171 TaxID=3110245 RepID=UPI002B1F5756|nr:amino acid adenylation domain-containing protein [Calothrix sp. UHCC 0171]MEA5574016.1 amino acid adenylation domain-containing protein [Calothrix sp. UHCC 0171]